MDSGLSIAENVEQLEADSIAYHMLRKKVEEDLYYFLECWKDPERLLPKNRESQVVVLKRLLDFVKQEKTK